MAADLSESVNRQLTSMKVISSSLQQLWALRKNLDSHSTMLNITGMSMITLSKKTARKRLTLVKVRKTFMRLTEQKSLYSVIKKFRWRLMSLERAAAFTSAGFRTVLKTAVFFTVLLSGQVMMRTICTDGTARTLMLKFMHM